MSSDALWRIPGALAVPATADAMEVTTFAKQLTAREQSQVISSFQRGEYELASTFVWTRAMSGLKKQLAALGVQFLAELLERSDIKAQDPIANVVTDHEALRLAEELRMFDGTESMRLRHALELVAHFSEAPEEGETPREMMREEAASIIRSCVVSVLGHERFEGAVHFAKFRKELEERTFRPDDPTIEQLLQSPPFFKRTTLRVLLTAVKIEAGAALQNAGANLDLLIQLLWKDLAKPDRWTVGKTYAELHNAGNKAGASSLGRTLTTVGGFDFVPENLRSNTFIGQARRVLAAHHGYNNFYNEPEPMKLLAGLGSRVPPPALPEVMTATLSVRMGNRYGESKDAQAYAIKLLDQLTPDEWRYFLDECLPQDSELLSKLREEKPRSRWTTEVVARYPAIGTLDLQHPVSKQFVAASSAGDRKKMIAAIVALYSKLHGLDE